MGGVLLIEADMADHGDGPGGASIRIKTAFAAGMGESPRVRHGEYGT